MHEAYASHCATCFSQPLLKFSFQKELNVSHLKGFLLNGHTKRFDHRLEIKTNKLKLKKLQNWSHDRFSFTDSKV